MFAIIDVGSKQYKVQENDLIAIPGTAKKKEVTIKDVLMVADGKDIKVGTPKVKGAKVTLEVLGAEKGPKTIAFKFKRRKSSQKTVGHRAVFTKVRVSKIEKGD